MHKNQRILFMAGFPRAGSTLLTNILAQNPKLYPTPTSGLVGSVIHFRNNWKKNEVFKSSGEEYIYPKIKTTIKNMIIGHYEEQILKGQIPIDKNRSWVIILDTLEEIFNCKIQIIYPIRHIGDCVISMEKVNRKSTLMGRVNGDHLNELTTKGRVENFLKKDGVFGQCLVQLRELSYKKQLDRLIFVPYNDLLTYPHDVLDHIYDQLELEKFQHDFNNIKQVINEHDMFHGFAPHSLHKIKEGCLEKPKPRDWSVLDKNFISNLENDKFKDITSFINNISRVHHS